jgi:hypothetical protein
MIPSVIECSIAARQCTICMFALGARLCSLPVILNTRLALSHSHLVKLMNLSVMICLPTKPVEGPIDTRAIVGADDRELSHVSQLVFHRERHSQTGRTCSRTVERDLCNYSTSVRPRGPHHR